MTELSSPVYQTDKPSRQICNSVAFIMAHSVKANNVSATTAKLLNGLLDTLKNLSKNESLQVFALLALGEIGRVYPQAFEVIKIRFFKGFFINVAPNF